MKTEHTIKEIESELIQIVIDTSKNITDPSIFDSFWYGDLEQNLSKESIAKRLISKAYLIRNIKDCINKQILVDFDLAEYEGIFYEVFNDQWYVSHYLIADSIIKYVVAQSKCIPSSILYIDNDNHRWMSPNFLRALIAVKEDFHKRFTAPPVNNIKSESKTYLMVDDNTGYVKIGRSFNPREREKTLQSEKPTISLIAVCHNNIESDLHKQYAVKKIRGEWFDLTKAQIKDIVDSYGFIFVKNKLFKN